jgi:hypothetical protein
VGARLHIPILDAVPLRNAVLCADCELITETRHDTCRVCGSHSVLSLARLLGGNVVGKRAVLLATSEESVVSLLSQLAEAAAQDNSSDGGAPLAKANAA